MTPALEFLAWRFLSCNNVKSNPRMTKSVHCGIPYVVNKNKTIDDIYLSAFLSAILEQLSSNVSDDESAITTKSGCFAVYYSTLLAS